MPDGMPEWLQFMIDNGLGPEDMETDGYGDRSSIG